MNKLIKWLLIVVVLLALVIGGLVLYVTRYLDINEFKDELVDTVKDKTGRELQIKGDIAFQLLPRLQLTLPQLSLANESGFEGPFATIEKAELSLDIWAVLHKEIKILNIALSKPRLSLATNAAGQNNWESLMALETASSMQAVNFQPVTDTQTAALEPLTAITLDHLVISNGEFDYVDASQDKTVMANNIDISVNDFKTDQAFPISLDADFVLTNPDMTSHNTLTGQMTIDTKQNKILFSGNTTESLVLPDADPMESDLDVNLDYAIDQDTLTLSKCEGQLLSLGQFALTGNATNVTSAPTAKFQLTGNKITLPNKLEIDTLQTTALYQDQKATLENLTLGLYEGGYIGNIEVDHSQPNLNINAIGRLHDVQAGPMLKDLIDTEALTGTLTFEHQLNTLGQEADDFTQNLYGPMTLTIEKGTLAGFDISYLFHEAKAQATGSENNRTDDKQTPIGELTADLMAKEGYIHNTALTFHDEDYRADGKGTIRLSDLFVDYELQTQLTKTQKESWLNSPLPLTITGAPESLSVMPDFKALFDQILKQQVKKQSDKVLDRLTEKFGKQLGEGVEDSKERGFGEELKNLPFGDLFKK